MIQGFRQMSVEEYADEVLMLPSGHAMVFEDEVVDERRQYGPKHFRRLEHGKPKVVTEECKEEFLEFLGANMRRCARG